MIRKTVFSRRSPPFSLALVFEVGPNYRPIEKIFTSAWGNWTTRDSKPDSIPFPLERDAHGVGKHRRGEEATVVEDEAPISPARKIPGHKSWAQVANRYGDRLLLLSGRRVITEITALVSRRGNIGTSRGGVAPLFLSFLFLKVGSGEREREKSSNYQGV